ncbi:ABC transporter permease [Clostridium drakei]|uniref:ABC transporter permease n=1 Tax=Clostridium drakei TaxID=332101 RepID=A0A2U8DLU3_9CLOT|nr:ABC transporter permease [Clostridium drakei]AWI03425.1 ABC transporter permease [Clostridium drakei]
MKYLSLEFFKMRHRGIFLTILFLLFMELAWCTFPLRRLILPLASDSSEAVWEALIMIVTMVKGLLFSVMIAVAVCRVNDMEHKGNTWRLLESSAERRESIWKAKFLSVFLLVSIAQVLESVYLVAYGSSMHIAEKFHIPAFLNYFIGSLAISAVIILIQQWISMTVENQLVAMAVGMLGGFLGLISMFLPSAVRYIFIWGYYVSLAPATFADTGEIKQLPVSVIPTLIALIMAVIFYYIGRRQFAKAES